MKDLEDAIRLLKKIHEAVPDHLHEDIYCSDCVYFRECIEEIKEFLK